MKTVFAREIKKIYLVTISSGAERRLIFHSEEAIAGWNSRHISQPPPKFKGLMMAHSNAHNLSSELRDLVSYIVLLGLVNEL